MFKIIRHKKAKYPLSVARVEAREDAVGSLGGIWGRVSPEIWVKRGRRCSLTSRVRAMSPKVEGVYPVTCGIRLGEGEERGGEGGVRGKSAVNGVVSTLVYAKWRGSQGAAGGEDKGITKGEYQG